MDFIARLDLKTHATNLLGGYMSEKKIDWVPLTKWKEHFQYPSQGAMRNICARRKDNGAEAFLSLVNGRYYIHIGRFNTWMEQQSHLRRA